jgi:hypothetical protein
LRAGAPPGPDRGDERGSRLLSEFDPDAFEPDATPPNGIPIVEPETAAQLLGGRPEEFESARDTTFLPVPPPDVLDTPTERTTADPGRALATSLLVWGAGLIWLGKPIGWLLVLLEILWIAALVLSVGLLPTDEWVVCYLLLAAFIVIWVGQAIWAYRVARRISGRTTGAAWLLAAAPVLIIGLTGFWLIAGAMSSPAATFQRYVGAWQHDNVAAAAPLFATPELYAQMTARWTTEDSLISKRVAELNANDPDLDLNAQDPRSNLRFVEQPVTPESASFEVQVVHDVTVPGTFLGFIPASRTETQVLAVLGHVTLARYPITGYLSETGAGIWQINGVSFVGEQP